MKRRLQLLSLFATALIAVHLMAQDNGGGAGAMGGGDASGAGEPGGASGADNSSGASGADNSGMTNSSGASGEGAGNTNSENSGNTNSENNGNTNGNTNGEGSLPTNGAGQGNGGGMGTFPPEGGLFGPAPTPGGEGNSTLFPSLSPTPAPTPPSEWGEAPATPTPSPSPSATPISPGTQGGLQPAPVTFNVPGQYGGAPQTLTLGQGRLAGPPFAISVSLSQGYNDNVYTAPSNYIQPTPVPTPTPPLLERLVGFRITPPLPPTPVYQVFREKIPAQPTPARPQGVVGSASSSLSLGLQIQEGSSRSVVVLSAALGAQDTYSEKGGENLTGSLDGSLVHKLSPRATLSIEANLVYQQTPNFALQNAPTSNPNNGSYFDGSAKIDLTYQWDQRISTVTSYSLSTNMSQGDSAGDVYISTYGTQFRYTVTARNVITAELRQSQGVYPQQPDLNSTATYYLIGLDSSFTARLRNVVSVGIEPINGRNVPYFNSATTLTLPRGRNLVWTNSYEAQQDIGAVDEQQTTFRSDLTYSQLLSAKISASLSLAYNYLVSTDSLTSAGTYTQNQIQGSLGFNYTLSPRFSLSLSFVRTELLSNQINQSYEQDLINLGGSYTF